MRFIVFFLLVFNLPLIAWSSTLQLEFAGETKKIESNRMKRMKSVQIVKLPSDPMFKDQAHSYWALPLSELVPEKARGEVETLELVASDGMTAIIEFAKIDKEAKAWLAFQPVKGPWPRTQKGQSIGPFYLIWTDPEKGGVGPEEWPYQVIKIRGRASVEKTYPLLVPPGQLAETHPVRKGMKVFLKQCVHCHTLNKQGPAQLGPDLNEPFSPTEYWKTSFLKKYIRDPKSLRHWPQSKMPGFDESELSEKDMRQLMSYLKHMSRHRNQSQ